MGAIGYAGFNLNIRDGMAFRFPEALRALAEPFNAQIDGWYSKTLQSDCNLLDVDTGFNVLCVKGGGKKVVVVWGDSHAAALVPGLVSLKTRHDFRLISLAAAKCLPIYESGFYSTQNYCSLLSNQSLRYIAQIRPSILIVSAAYDHSIYNIQLKVFEEKLESALQFIAKNSPETKIVVVGPTPRWKTSPQAKFFRNILLVPESSYQLPFLEPDRLITDYDDYLAGASKKYGWIYISPNRTFCNHNLCRVAIMMPESKFMFLDYGHLSSVGSIYLIQLNEKLLF